MGTPVRRPALVRRYDGRMLSGTCAFCGNKTHFTARSGRVMEELEGNQYPKYLFEIAATCDACHRFNVVRGTREAHRYFEIGSVIDGSTLLTEGEAMAIESWSPPAMRTANTDHIPAEIAGFYQEAHDTYSVGAFRAVLLLARSVIEATAKVNSVGGKDLLTKIDNLHEEGLVRRGVREVAHAIRVLGNDIAHGDLTDPPTMEDADDVLQLVRMILDDVYVADAVRADILKRRGKA